MLSTTPMAPIIDACLAGLSTWDYHLLSQSLTATTTSATKFQHDMHPHTRDMDPPHVGYIMCQWNAIRRVPPSSAHRVDTRPARTNSRGHVCYCSRTSVGINCSHRKTPCRRKIQPCNRHVAGATVCNHGVGNGYVTTVFTHTGSTLKFATNWLYACALKQCYFFDCWFDCGCSVSVSTPKRK